ncbi:MAG: DUF2188 domain-containing protein [Acidobacteria bacterium]|nr:DUF2188 domain-containing protein [Acidobacteriota bacterium]
MPRRTPHVVPRNGNWAVKCENTVRASSLHRTQAEAIATGREIARAERTELVIHGRDGRIREKDSHGHDPFPPIG